jgi:hypothetical protein
VRDAVPQAHGFRVASCDPAAIAAERTGEHRPGRATEDPRFPQPPGSAVPPSAVEAALRFSHERTSATRRVVRQCLDRKQCGGDVVAAVVLAIGKIGQRPRLRDQRLVALALGPQAQTLRVLSA